MNDCPLTQLDNGKWHCPVCDPDKRRLLPVKARRNCRPGRKPYGTRGKSESIQTMVDRFDALMESGDDNAADELGKRIWCMKCAGQRRVGAGKHITQNRSKANKMATVARKASGPNN